MVKIFIDLLHGIEPNNIKLNQLMEFIEFLIHDFKTDPKHKSKSHSMTHVSYYVGGRT